MNRFPAALRAAVLGAPSAEADAVPPDLAAFERRRLRNLGTVVTRADIARRGNPPLLDLLRATPGVAITGSGRGTHVTRTHTPSLRHWQPVPYVDGQHTNRSQDRRSACAR